MAETVAERLRRLRVQRGLSQRELACPGVSFAYISRIEAGTRQPSVKALRQLAAKLGVTTAYLETGSDEIVDHPAYRELLTIIDRLEDERDAALQRVAELRKVLDPDPGCQTAAP